ncbi:MAG TPA: WYL domain-containing protein [Spirochaetota bacterium]|nr:WYL domain-containing protein [Spirochaetota bacterium]HPR49675.1 WYL domain-containing protein [Spirochaetota bacterium]
MDKQITIPDPEKKLAIIKRFLHIIALLQNPKDPRDWNGNSLADILSRDESDVILTDKNIRDYINKNIIDELGIDVDIEKGSRRIELAAPLGRARLDELINIYCLFVATDSAREVILSQLIKRHPDDCLWMLASIYFAAKTKKRIEFDYTTNDNRKIHCTMNPYHLVLRNNNLYLFGRRVEQDHTSLLIVNRFENLKINDQSFDENVPSIDEAFRDTLGSFLGKKYHVRLRYANSRMNQMEQFLGILEPQITKSDDGEWFEARFTVSDDQYLCKQLFMYGKDVEILEPGELRDLMIDMLKESAGVYG